MSDGGEGLSKGLAHQVENGLLSSTLGPLSRRVEGGQPPLKSVEPGADPVEGAEAVGTEVDEVEGSSDDYDEPDGLSTVAGIDYAPGGPYA
ncbi:MAG TPA: hypothetical protein VIF43_01665 [Patescibacteria group bacterium]|jgi:hypothetical protein